MASTIVVGLVAVSCSGGSDAADTATTTAADDSSSATSSAPPPESTVVGSSAPATSAASETGEPDSGDAEDDGADDGSSTDSVTAGAESILDLIAHDPQFSQLAGLVERSGLDERFAVGAVTMFAPTDEAFDQAFATLGPDAFATLVGDDELVEPLVLHHLTTGRVLFDDLTETDVLPMLDGTDLEVESGQAGATVRLRSGETAVSIGAEPPAILAGDDVVYVIDELLVPPGLLDAEALEIPPDLVVRFADGRYVLDGAVADESQRRRVIEAATRAVAADNVVDQLIVDPLLAPIDADLDRMLAVVPVAPTELAPATVTLTGAELEIRGRFATEENRAAIETLGSDVGAVVEISARPLADPDTAAELDAELDAIVAETPLTFEPNSAVLTAEATPTIQRLAARIRSLGGASVVVEGHTDSGGRPATNQRLSEERAAAVVAGLVAAGVIADRLTAVGFGSSRPVLVGGAEDAAASRRVEFTVAVPTG